MCAVGDIIRIDSYISEDGVDMSHHSFIEILDKQDKIKINIRNTVKEEVAG